MAAVFPRFPSDVTIIRARRGATASSAKKQNRIYTVRREKAMDAAHWPKEHNPYYADVVSDPSRIADIVEGAEIPGVKDMNPAAECLPEDMWPAPDQVAPGAEVSEAGFETGGMTTPTPPHPPPRNCARLPTGCAEIARFGAPPRRGGGKAR